MRLQILELPVQHIGDVMHTPFILVISETPDGYNLFEAERNTSFRESTGAAGVIVTAEHVDIGPA